MERELKINTLLRLLKGEVTPNDLQPSLSIKIGYENENIYLKNGKVVTKETFDKACNDSLIATGCSITYGSTPNGVEYYY